MKRVLSAGLTLWLVLPTLALAATAGEPEGQGMPQLNFRSPLTMSQVVWMAIIFLVLYLLLTYWALPQVDQVLETRARTIAADLDAARAAKAESDAAVAELSEATRRAHTEAQAAIAEALARAKAEAAAEQAQANARLEAQLAAAEQRIGEARTAAMGALREVATDTAQMVVRRLTGRAAEPVAVDAAVATALAARAT
jgi:F-type H+-transporting ATPase subunit b